MASADSGPDNGGPDNDGLDNGVPFDNDSLDSGAPETAQGAQPRPRFEIYEAHLPPRSVAALSLRCRCAAAAPGSRLADRRPKPLVVRLVCLPHDCRHPRACRLCLQYMRPGPLLETAVAARHRRRRCHLPPRPGLVSPAACRASAPPRAPLTTPCQAYHCQRHPALRRPHIQCLSPPKHVAACPLLSCTAHHHSGMVSRPGAAAACPAAEWAN